MYFSLLRKRRQKLKESKQKKLLNMVFLWPGLLELELECMLCTKHISIKDINIRRDRNLQVVVVVAVAAAVIEHQLIAY